MYLKKIEIKNLTRFGASVENLATFQDDRETIACNKVLVINGHTIRELGNLLHTAQKLLKIKSPA